MSVSVGTFFEGIALTGTGLLIVYGCHRCRTSDRCITWTINNLIPRLRSDHEPQRTAAVLRLILVLFMGFGALCFLFGVATLVTLVKA